MILFNDWHWNFGKFRRKDEEFLFEYDEKTSDFVLNQEFLGKFGKRKQRLVESDFQECGLNEGSGNVWLVGYEYLSCFFADIEGNVGVCATCVKCGAEKEFWLEKDTREEALEAFELAESHVCECKQGEENQ